MKQATTTEVPIICEGFGPRRFFRLPRIGPHLPDSAEIKAWVRDHRLSEDERAVYDLLAERRSVAEMAEVLSMDPRDIAGCIERIHAKIDDAQPSKVAV